MVLCFDVESDSLSGRPFAVGGVVIDRNGRVLSTIYAELHEHLHSPSEWVRANVYPALAERRSPELLCDLPTLYARFWAWLQEWKAKGSTCVVDCGSPVEGGFLRDVLAHGAATGQWSEFGGPYPLHEVATSLHLRGHGDPDRFVFAGMTIGNVAAGIGRIERHDPVSDAYASAICWGKA